MADAGRRRRGGRFEGTIYERITWFAAEYTQADVSTPVGPDPSFDGGYLQVGYYLTGEHRRDPLPGDFRREVAFWRSVGRFAAARSLFGGLSGDLPPRSRLLAACRAACRCEIAVGRPVEVAVRGADVGVSGQERTH